MKKLLAVSTLVIAPLCTGLAFADTGPGCGLGAQVFNGKSGTVSHVLAATTNGTFGNQTFGMTFGTSGCDTSKPVEYVAFYINSNLDRVAVAMAAGEGESLDALASLLKIEEADRSRFAELVKAQFDVIYPSSTASAEDVYQALNEVLAADAVLSKYAV